MRRGKVKNCFLRSRLVPLTGNHHCFIINVPSHLFMSVLGPSCGGRDKPLFLTAQCITLLHKP